ncbi:hypothetical protein BLAT2472_70075 [Burkholderia latens]
MHDRAARARIVRYVRRSHASSGDDVAVFAEHDFLTNKERNDAESNPIRPSRRPGRDEVGRRRSRRAEGG